MCSLYTSGHFLFLESCLIPMLNIRPSLQLIQRINKVPANKVCHFNIRITAILIVTTPLRRHDGNGAQYTYTRLNAQPTKLKKEGPAGLFDSRSLIELSGGMSTTRQV
jgi:hypothetical protein